MLKYKGIVAGSSLGITLGVIGFVYTRFGTPGMGLSMFLLIPVVAGFVIGLFARGAWAVALSGAISVVCVLVLLIAARFEGFLCALMASPLLVVNVAIGAAIGFAVQTAFGRSNERSTTMGMLVVAVPLLVYTGKHAEKPLLDHARIESVVTSIRVPATVESTWTDIQSIDSLHGSKPWLMHVGLPVPQRCTLDGRGVGARRTCYFDKGYIDETVTEWDPPRRLGLIINRTHMPGRHWLGFESAVYDLRPEGQGTRLSRTTVISSHLHPAWYWRPLERWGVSSEHIYILNDVVERERAER